MRTLRHANRGFTLLEILIAMAVFAIMAAMAYSGLSAVLDARESTAKRSESLAEMQRLIYLLNEDLSQAVPRQIRDEFGDLQPAFTGGTDEQLLMFTRSVPEIAQVENRSHLQRVRYRLENGVLYRQVWVILDRTQQSQYRQKKLLNTDAVKIRFYNGGWGSADALEADAMPKAVEISFTLPGLGEIQRQFLVQP